jgi:hypothetical protein
MDNKEIMQVIQTTLLYFVIFVVAAICGYVSYKIVNPMLQKKEETPPTAENFENYNIENYESLNNDFENPIYQHVNRQENRGDLNNIMNEMGGNMDEWSKKRLGPNHASTPRTISYIDSDYRYDNMSKDSQSKLDEMYSNSLVFRNYENDDNDQFTGMNDNSTHNYAPAEFEQFNRNELNPEQKVLDMFTSSNYLPNEQLTDKRLKEGFQILDNPTNVTDTNLIPVMRASGTGTILGCKKNMSRDIRGDIPIPKTVISPFNNSALMPDIYASNRGRL